MVYKCTKATEETVSVDFLLMTYTHASLILIPLWVLVAGLVNHVCHEYVAFVLATPIIAVQASGVTPVRTTDVALSRGGDTWCAALLKL